ncbi:MAG: OmpA family protein [Pseudohongiella sp.]|uniref:flagellar protein MotY n=1 Tax=Pseudohongiella sp. TaxID=1979412 RepID=UPI00349FD452
MTFVTSTASAGTVSSYYADIDVAGWQADSSVFECLLVQQIPGLGQAVFYHQAGDPLSFYLQTPNTPMQAGRALLTSQPPVWRQELEVRDLGYVDVAISQQPVTLDAQRSRLLMAELDRGMVPTLMRRAWFNDQESIHVGLSPVHFSDAYAEYHQCIAGLLPVNFAQIERSTVFWQPNQRELTDDMKAQLDDIITYTQADPRVSGFEVNGFTDGAGNPRENFELSRIRAFAVHQYLVENGINEDMLNTRFFGSAPQFRIVEQERSAADRDRNRRVTIRLLRD